MKAHITYKYAFRVHVISINMWKSHNTGESVKEAFTVILEGAVISIAYVYRCRKFDQGTTPCFSTPLSNPDNKVPLNLAYHRTNIRQLRLKVLSRYLLFVGSPSALIRLLQLLRKGIVK